MHGRLKVRTSEEQAEAKRKEKAKKVKLYRHATEKIFSKRAAGEKDDEMLKLTTEILRENSDVATMWIIRREVFETRLPTMSTEEATDLCLNELTLLEQCLRVNPKAYCVWVHRQWILEHSPFPDWVKEKSLCDLYLTHDERNFHCWDHRRFVIKKANVSIEDEFKFTTDKIAYNFSNYSAWHYRSKLLPQVLTSGDTAGLYSLDNEYDMAHNAFYTDPSDQSPWFYHKWLLGRGVKPLIIGCGLFQRDPSPSVTVAFNQQIKPTEEDPLVISVNDSVVTRIVKADWPRRMWSCDLSIAGEENVTVSVRYKNTFMELKIESDNKEAVWFIGNLSEMFRETITGVTLEVLQSELVICKELLELEPNNKWCVLTTLQLLEAVDPLGNHGEILNLFDKLVIVDPYRKGYYSDLRSRHVIGYELMKHFTKFDPKCQLDLSNKGLTRLYYPEYMMICQHIDLHGNKLACRSLDESLRCMSSARSLDLSDNGLVEVPAGLATLPLLTSLQLDNNGITNTQLLWTCKRLCSLSVRQNPMDPGSVDNIKKHLSALEHFDF